MPTLTEEILLLTLDDDGRFLALPEHAMEFALTSAVLMDLALRRRIDTDLEQLVVVDPTPLADDILDPVLAGLARSPKPYNAKRWVSVLSQEGGAIRERALARLVARGVLRRQDEKVLWVFGRRRYPLEDGREVAEAKLRIVDVLSSDRIPEMRDVVLVALARAAGLFEPMLGAAAHRDARTRIDEIARLDLIGRSLTEALVDVRKWGRMVGSPREGVFDQRPEGG